jgi:hypothetical protein
MTKAATCSRCEQPAVIKQGHQALCSMHYRFGQMRCLAKRRGLAVPSHSKLHELHALLFEMHCPHCQRQMNWRASDGQSTVISLQHYRDGSYGLICRACNTRHAKMPGDTFCLLPDQHKACGRCKSILPMTEFDTDNSGRWLNKSSCCKTCRNAKHKEWVAKDRDYVNAKQREGRQRRAYRDQQPDTATAQHIALGIGGAK